MSDQSELYTSLGRIEGKLDALLITSTDHEVRVRALERKSSWLAGVAASLGAVGGLLWNLFFGSKH